MGAKMRVQTHLLNGRRIGKFVDLKPLDTAATVQEAIDKGYLVGKKELAVQAVSGVIRSMAKSISKDGNGRKIDGYVSIQPSISCKLMDNCQTVTKDNVTARLRARVLKQGLVDTKDWSFTVEGASGSMDITSITTGEVMDEVVIGEAIDINGSDLALEAADTITWRTSDGTQTKTGTIAVADRVCTNTRITTGANVLAALTGATWEGQTIVFTIVKGSQMAIRSATLRVAS